MIAKGVNPCAAETIDYDVFNQANRPPVRTTSDVLALFDKAEAVRMVYVPHFLRACAARQAEEVCSLLVRERVSEYRKQTHRLRELAAGCDADLRREMPFRVYRRFEQQRDAFLDYCSSLLEITRYTIANELLKNYGDIPHAEMYARAHLVAAICAHVGAFDEAAAREMARRLGTASPRVADTRVAGMEAVCREITARYPECHSHHVENAMKAAEAKAREAVKILILKEETK